jgi:hypothetical protein
MKKTLFIFLVFALPSCSKQFLDRQSLSQIGGSSFWATKQDALLGINGIYNALQDRVQYSGSLNAEVGLPLYDNFGDNCYNSYKWEGAGSFIEGTIDPSYFFFNDLWSSLYKGIGRANIAIENISKMPSSGVSDADRKMLIGQALFLRALFYMNLAVYYQDVPLILTPQTLAEAYVPKNTYQEVSDQIIKDLKAAAASLPTSYPASQYGYATQGAAYGLLARFYLYNHDYQDALDATTQVMGLGYTLNPSYAQLFTPQGESSNEIIFSIKFSADITTTGELFSSFYSGVPKIDEQPMPNLVNDYYCTDGKPISASPLYSSATPKANRDPRLAASVYFIGDIFVTDLNFAFKGNTATKYGLKKYLKTTNAAANGTTIYGPGNQDFIVLRYADVLLMRAEALVELNQLSGVYSLVDNVRARVSMPKVESVEGAGLSQSQLRTIVKHERRIELAFEGLRFFDLKRWGQIPQAIQAAQADKIPGYNPAYRSGKSEIFPIPQPQLDADHALQQNPVWN